jgi:hypothetical protein
VSQDNSISGADIRHFYTNYILVKHEKSLIRNVKILIYIYRARERQLGKIPEFLALNRLQIFLVLLVEVPNSYYLHMELSPS